MGGGGGQRSGGAHSATAGDAEAPTRGGAPRGGGRSKATDAVQPVAGGGGRGPRDREGPPPPRRIEGPPGLTACAGEGEGGALGVVWGAPSPTFGHRPPSPHSSSSSSRAHATRSGPAALGPWAPDTAGPPEIKCRRRTRTSRGRGKASFTSVGLRASKALIRDAASFGGVWGRGSPGASRKAITTSVCSGAGLRWRGEELMAGARRSWVAWQCTQQCAQQLPLPSPKTRSVSDVALGAPQPHGRRRKGKGKGKERM